MSKAFIVIGCHRSATSAVAKGLHRAGFPAGDPANMVFGEPDNPDGFYEDLALVRLNDQLLDEFGGAWDLPPDPAYVEAQAQAGATRAHAYLMSRHEQHSGRPWSMKDPRLVLTWPVWRCALTMFTVPFEPILIRVLRDPERIAASASKIAVPSRTDPLELAVHYHRLQQAIEPIH